MNKKLFALLALSAFIIPMVLSSNVFAKDVEGPELDDTIDIDEYTDFGEFDLEDVEGMNDYIEEIKELNTDQFYKWI